MEQVLVRLRQEQKSIEDAVFSRLPPDYVTFVKQWATHQGIGMAISVIEQELAGNAQREENDEI